MHKNSSPRRSRYVNLNRARRAAGTTRAIAAAVERLEPRTLWSAISWNGGSGDWSDASKWSGGVVPNGNDDVTINAGATVTISQGESANTITTAAGSTLTLNSGVQLNIDSNSANSTISGTFHWNGSISTSAATLLTLAGSTNLGGLLLSGVAANTGAMAVNNGGLAGGTMTNSGAMSIANGMVLSVVTFTNASGSTITLTDNSGFLSAQGGGVATNANFINKGTFTQNGGAGTSTIGIHFENVGGTVNVDSGNLILSGQSGTVELDTATLNVATGSTLTINTPGSTNTTHFAGTLTGSGGGIVSVVGGNISNNHVDGSQADAVLSFPQGMLQVANASIQGAPNDAPTPAISNSGFVDFVGSTGHGALSMFNNGTINLKGSSDLPLFYFVNNASGVLSFQADVNLTNGGDVVAKDFQNFGTISKSGTSGTSIINSSFINQPGGAINIESGTLSVQTGDSQLSAGPINIAANSVLNFNTNTHVYLSGTFTSTGAGTVSVSSGFFTGLNDSSATADVVLNFAPNTLLLQGGDIVNGTFNKIVNTGNLYELDGGPIDNFINKGSFFVGGTQITIAKGSVITNAPGGIFVFVGAPSIVTGINAAIENQGTMLVQAGANTLDLATPFPGIDFVTNEVEFNNTGTVEVASGTLQLPVDAFGPTLGQIAAGQTYQVDAAAALITSAADPITTNNGWIILHGAGAFFQNISGLANNTGTFQVDSGASFTTAGSLINTGTLVVGGALTVAGDLTESGAASTLQFAVSGPPASVGAPTLKVNGNTALAGNLTAAVVGGFATSGGQSYPVATFTAPATGAFASTTGVGPNFTAAVGPSSIALNTSGGSTGASDLSISSVTAPASGSPGSSATINWQVTNPGTSAAGGAWSDSVFLASNGTIDNASILLGRVPHAGPVAAGDGYTGTLTTTLPAVPVGSYKVVVLVDSALTVSDVDRTNNLGVSSPLAISIPSLALGATTSGNINVNQDLLYALSLTAGMNIVLSGTFATGTEADLYVSYGVIPTPTASDESATATAAPSSTVLISAAQSGNYYVLVHGREGAGGGPSYSLRPDLKTFGAQLITPNVGGNNGIVSAVISGFGFTNSTTATLISQANSSETVPASQIQVIDSGKLVATFDLTGQPVGKYDLKLTDGSTTDTLAGAFNVQGAQAGGLVYNLNFPTVSRGDLFNTAYLQYTNTGNTDLPAPLFYISGNNVKFELPGQTAFIPGSVEMVGISPTGLAGVLTPGESVTVPIKYSQITIIPHQDFTLQVSSFDALPGTDLTSLEADFKPLNEPTVAWNIISDNFSAMAAAQPNGISDLLRNAATALSLQGTYSSDPWVLANYAFQQAGDFGAITQRHTFGAFGTGQADPFNQFASTLSNGNVIIFSGSAERIFLKQLNGTYQGVIGDTARLSLSGGGIYTVTEPTGRTTVFNANGSLNYFQDTNGNRLTAHYTGSQLTSLVATNGDTYSFTYNPDGLISQVIDPEGRATSYAYDAFHTLTSITTPLGTTTFSYSTGNAAASSAISEIDYPDGSHRFYTYDSFGRLSSQSRDGGSQMVNYTYDNFGNVTAIDALGNSTTSALGPNQQVVQIVNGLGNIARIAYDSQGRPSGTTTPGGFTTTVARDSNGNTTAITDPNGSTTNFSYDPTLSRLLSLTDGNGNVTTYTYDASGNALTSTDAASQTTNYTYNSIGLPTQVINPNATGQTITYNSVGLVTQRTFASGETVAYTYDAHRNILTAVDSVSGTTTFTYDPADRLTSVSEPNSLSLTYTYNSLGQLTKKVDQTSFTTNYSYNAVGQLTEVADGSGNAIATYTYDAAGNLSRVDNANGTATVYTYDAAGHTLSIVNHAPNNSVNSSFTYTYSAEGLRSSMTSGAGTTAYTYDPDGQLAKVVLPGGRTIVYAYDAVGNRITVSDSAAGTVSYSTDHVNEYVTVGDTTYTYDQDGNLLSSHNGSGTTTYTYDARGQLASITEPGHTFVYTYDALGTRISVSDNGVVTKYLVDPTGAGNVAGAFTSTGSVVDHYVYGVGLAGAVDGSGNPSFYDFDASGNTADVTNSSGSVASSFTYLPFGQVLSSSGPGSLFTFAGQYGVQNTGDGLYFMQARSYDPKTGRFIQRDPASLGGGDVNLYRYAVNDPVSHVDPSGTTLIPTIAQGLAFLAENGYLPLTVADNLAAVGIGSSATSAGLAGLIANDSLLGVSANLPAIYVPPFPELPPPTLGLGAVGEVGTAAPATTAVTFSGGVNAGVVATSPVIVYGGAATVILGPLAFNVVDNYLRSHYPDGIPVPVQNVLNPAALQNTLHKPSIQSLIDDFIRLNGHPPDQDQLNRLIQYGNSVDNGTSTAYLKAHLTKLYPDNTFVNANDPNDIFGPAGAGAAGFVQGNQTFPYEITFENKPTAGAPAKTVTVVQQLDSNLDWTSFQLTGMGFGSHVVDVPAGLTAFQTSVIVSDSLRVDISAAINVLTGVVTWTFTSIDPATGDVPAAALAGFLPPDDSAGDGSGFVSYSVNPKSSLTTGATIQAQATITFDGNAPINTPNILNTIDSVAPTSAVSALPATQSSTNFTVSWSGADDSGGSGIASYTVFVSMDGGAFTTWLPNTAVSSAVFQGTPGHSYSFYSAATDGAGNVENATPAPQATTAVPAVVRTLSVSAGKPATYTDSAGQKVTITLTGAGTGTLSFITADNSDPVSFTLDNTTTATNVIVTVRNRGFTTLSAVQANGSLGAFIGPSANLSGSFVITGTVRLLQLHDAAVGQSTINIKGTGVASVIRLGTLHDLILNDAGAISLLSAASWTHGAFNSDSINAQSISTLLVTHDFDPNLTLSSTGRSLAAGIISGTVAGGTWNLSGSAGTIRTGTIASSWTGNFAGAISVFIVRGSMSGAINAPSIGTFVVTGALSGATVTLTSAGSDVTVFSVTGAVSASTLNLTGSATRIIAGSFVDGSAANVGGDITTLLSRGTFSGNVTARSIRLMLVSKDMTSSALTLTGTAAALGKTPTLGSLLVTGKLANSTVRSAGNITSVVVGAASGSTVFAGVNDTVTTLPAVTTDFASESSILSFTARGVGAFADTLIAAVSMGSAVLRNVTTDNGGTPFGIAANTLTAFSYTSPGKKPFSWNHRQSPALLASLPDDLKVRVFAS